MTAAVGTLARSGASSLDAVLPGLEPGQLWVVVGPRGVGVTELCISMVRHAGTAAAAARVIVGNSHLDARHVSARIGRSPTADVVVIENFALPELGRYPAWATPAGVTSTDLVVYDTVDETLDDDKAPDREGALVIMRQLRRTARVQSTTVLATFRVAPDAPTRAGAARAWRTHRWHEAAMDAGDVVIILADGARASHVDVSVESRMSRRASCEIYLDPTSGRFVDGLS